MKKFFSSYLFFSFIILFFYLIFVFLRLKTFDFNPSYFINAGRVFCDISLVPRNLVVVKKSGYDGQFYYRFSLNPFTSKKTEFGITLDAPPYRHQRIIYPILVWLFSVFGRYKLVPLMMIIVNLLFLFLIAYVSLKLFDKNLYSVTLSMLPGFVLSLSRNLLEIVSSFFVILFLYFFKKKKYFLCTIVLTLAILTKETTLAIAAGGLILCVFLFFNKKYDELKHIYKIFIFPIIIWLIWQMILYYNWGEWAFKYGKGNFSYPFSGIFMYLVQLSIFTNQYRICCLTIFIFIMIFSLNTFLSFKHIDNSTNNMFLKIVWILYFCEVLFGSVPLWDNINPLRVFSEFFIFGFILLLISNFKLKSLITTFSFILWFAMAYIKIIKL